MCALIVLIMFGCPYPVKITTRKHGRRATNYGINAHFIYTVDFYLDVSLKYVIVALTSYYVYKQKGDLL